VPDIKFDIDSYVHTWHITYVVTLNSAALDLENGKMVLVIKGHAHTGTSWLPDFNFTLKQDITIAVSGSNADLVFGHLSFDTSSTIVDIFKSRATAAIERIRDRAIAQSGAQATVRKMLSAEQNLGGFLRSLLTPARATPPVQPLEFSLEYSSAEIRAGGIVLHGSVGVPAWPPPRVEYEVITAAGGIDVHPLPETEANSGPDYSALKSWIPGGTIQQFRWHAPGSPGYTDHNRFVYLHESPPVSAGAAIARSIGGYTPLCLTIEGTRLTAAGSVATESVAATICGFRSFPVLTESALDGLTISLARGSRDGSVEIVGHASAASSSAGNPAPNLIVHFADERSASGIRGLVEALNESGRTDAATAILVVADSTTMPRLKFVDGIAYTEDAEKWRHRYDAPGSGAFTVIVDPSGKPRWRKEGPVEKRELAATLKKVLARGSAARAKMATASARVGQPAPNFVFEHAKGQQLTLRKLAGRAVTVVFFRRSSAPSVEAVRDAVQDGDRIVLAVTDEDPQKTELPRDAIVVRDRDRRIASAYGVTIWPAIFSIDGSGIVRHIAYGRTSEGEKSRA
jgi:peroxiredoxin